LKVPGTWEIPIAALALTKRAKNKPDGIVALGCILQGQTTHAQLLGGDVSSALMRLQMNTGIPIAWGILTPDTAEQALDRAGMKHGNKGREAALAALEMANVVAALS
jgi:6,7-dimethyl-8-ribityllumazine synthase